MARSSKVVAVPVPPESAEGFERLAVDEGLNSGDLFREMLRVYQAYRDTRTFESLQRYGAAQAAHRGIRTEADADRLIGEARE